MEEENTEEWRKSSRQELKSADQPAGSKVRLSVLPLSEPKAALSRTSDRRPALSDLHSGSRGDSGHRESPLLAGGVTAGHSPAKALGARLFAATGGADESLLGQQIQQIWGAGGPRELERGRHLVG